MDFGNIVFDQSKLLKMWKETKQEVEDAYEKKEYCNDHDDKDDYESEIRYLKEKLKQSMHREDDMEDEVSALSYEKEKLEIEKQNVV